MDAFLVSSLTQATSYNNKTCDVLTTYRCLDLLNKPTHTAATHFVARAASQSLRSCFRYMTEHCLETIIQSLKPAYGFTRGGH